ncbi:hypothetical protein HPB47_018334, partial [Ixodes persulcatus]
VLRFGRVSSNNPTPSRLRRRQLPRRTAVLLECKERLHESSGSGLAQGSLPSGSLYPGIGVMDASTPPYYPPVSSPFPEYFTSSHPMYHYTSEQPPHLAPGRCPTPPREGRRG